MTIDQYNQQFDLSISEKLNELTFLLRRLMPNCEETFAYQMPTFKVGKNIIHFAVQKHHIGIYPGPDAILKFKDKLKDYKHSKGSFQIPLDQPLPLEIIEEIVIYNLYKYNKITKSPIV